MWPWVRKIAVGAFPPLSVPSCETMSGVASKRYDNPSCRLTSPMLATRSDFRRPSRMSLQGDWSQPSWGMPASWATPRTTNSHDVTEDWPLTRKRRLSIVAVPRTSDTTRTGHGFRGSPPQDYNTCSTIAFRAGVAKLADARDSKSRSLNGECGFDSLLRHGPDKNAGNERERRE